MKPPPKIIMAIVGVLSAFIVVSGVIGLWQSIDAVAWFRIGFEAVLTLAGVIGLLTAMGRFNRSLAWALVSISGTVLVCALLANATKGQGQTVGMSPSALVLGALKSPFAASRLGAAGVIGVLSVLVLLLQAPGVAMGRLARGVVCLAPVGALAWLWFAGPLKGWAGGLDIKIQVTLWIVAFFGLLVLVSAGVHFLIRSLEAGGEAIAKQDVTSAGNEIGSPRAHDSADAKENQPIAEE